MRGKIIQIYSVIICIVAVITFIISLSNFISSMIDKSDPLSSSWGDSEIYSSFENYKMEKMNSVSTDQAYIPDDEALQNMYESAKDEKIKTSLHRINRNITVSGLIMGLALVLFGLHWWILKRSSKP